MGFRVRIPALAALGAGALVLSAAGCGGGALQSPSGAAGGTSASHTTTAPGTAGTPSGSGPPPSPSPTPYTAPPGPSSPPGSAALGQYAAGRSTVVADKVYPQYGDTATDVLHYGLDLAWDPASKVLSGTATLTIRAAGATDRFVLDLADPMALGAVTVDGVAASPTRDGNRLTVPLGRQEPADTVSTVVIAYHGTPHTVAPPMTRGDIPGVGASVTSEGAVWAQQEPYGAFTWFPCNDQPSDKALYDVSITVPDGWSGVSGGAFAGRTESGGKAVDTWHQPDPVATYLVAFAVDRFKEDTATGPDNLPITYWYLPADAVRVHQLTAQVPEMLTFLEQRFGPYPFPTAGVLFVPQLVGMETQTMITLGSMLPADDLLHEFAHQWFGDAVTPKTWSDLWLNEGFAMYAQFQWDAAHIVGAGVPPMDFDLYLKQNVLPRDQPLRSTDGPPGNYNPTHFASSNVYFCPALMLNEIRHQVGDKAFTALLTDWSHHAADSSQDRASFIAFADQHTGKNLTALINTWLDSPTTPVNSLTAGVPAASTTTGASA